MGDVYVPSALLDLFWALHSNEIYMSEITRVSDSEEQRATELRFLLLAVSVGGLAPG